MIERPLKILYAHGPAYITGHGFVGNSLGTLFEGVDPIGAKAVSGHVAKYALNEGRQIDSRLGVMVPGKMRQLKSMVEQSDVVLASARLVDSSLALELAVMARSRGKPIVVGGYGPTLSPRTYDNSGAGLFAGEFGPLAREFCDAMFGGKLGPEATFSSVGRHDDYSHGYVWPDRSLGTNPANARFQLLTGRRRETMTWMAGCSGFCQYCCTVRMQGGGNERMVRCRTASDIISEIESLKLRSGDILFLTDNNTGLIPRKTLVEVLLFLREKGLYFMTESTLAPLLHDYEQYRDANGESALLDLMSPKKGPGGCIGLAYGADDTTLNKVKGSRDKELDALLRGAPMLHELGIPLHLMFVVGLNHHTYPEVFYNVANIIDTLQPPVAIIHVATPYSKTVFGDPFWNDGLVTETDWLKFNHQRVVFQPKGMTAEELQQGYYFLNRHTYEVNSGTKRKLWTNFDSEIWSRDKKLAMIVSGWAHFFWKWATVKEMGKRGLFNRKMQLTLDMGYKEWRRAASLQTG